jgi:hypothetical protein
VHANDIRVSRAAVRRRIASGTISPSEALLSCPSEVETMSVFRFLRGERRWGPARCRMVLTAVQLSEIKTIGSLTERQRSLVVAVLAETEPAKVIRREIRGLTSPARFWSVSA